MEFLNEARDDVVEGTADDFEKPNKLGKIAQQRSNGRSERQNFLKPRHRTSQCGPDLTRSDSPPENELRVLVALPEKMSSNLSTHAREHTLVTSFVLIHRHIMVHCFLVRCYDL